jgi:hypothetical protein
MLQAADLSVDRVAGWSFPMLKYVSPTRGRSPPGPGPAVAATSTRMSLCATLLLGAILILAAAGSTLVLGAALGLLGIPLIVGAGAAAAIGLGLLVGRMLEGRDCLATRYLQRYFGVMAALLVALAGPFLLAGMLGAAAGAWLVAVPFGLIVATLTAGASRLDAISQMRRLCRPRRGE